MILADIGGTYARFAVPDKDSKTIRHHKRYEAEAFPDLAAALKHYCADYGLEPVGKLAVSTAAYPDSEGRWRFVNRNRWVIDAPGLQGKGWDLALILNDFKAAAWGISDLQSSECRVLKSGVNAKAGEGALALIGPGTGLGLAYLDEDRKAVRGTHGGHFLCAALEDDQAAVIRAFHHIKPGVAPVFESFVSGPGLMTLYRCVCAVHGIEPQAETPESLIADIGRTEVAETLRFFHEFLGLFAHTSVVCGHAYGGLYLTGGVLERLDAAGLFDFARFNLYFCLKGQGVASVNTAVENMPVNLVTTPYLAFKGLMHRLGDAAHA